MRTFPSITGNRLIRTLRKFGLEVKGNILTFPHHTIFAADDFSR
jgi:hypothetical protein